MIDDVAHGLDMGVSFSLIDDEALNIVMEKPWHGKRFSKRIWDNTDRLAKEVQEITARYIVSGRNINKAIEEIKTAFDVEEFHAATLIHTEVAHARSLSDLKAYEECGAEYYRYLAALDERTCPICGGLDGQRFKVSEAEEGVNYPVLHPRCRCTTTIDGEWVKRSARDMITGRSIQVDGSLDYNSWRESMSDEEKTAFESARRKYKNKAADKAQHEKYREILGKEVPHSLDKFQELKYNGGEKWESLKSSKQERLNQMDFKDMSGLIGTLGNKEVRLWYKAHDENIIDLIDRSQTLEQQARQACEMRNYNRTAARELMKDQEQRKQLDLQYPNLSFEFYYKKYKVDKKTGTTLSDDDVYKIIIQKSTTTNKEVDIKAGVGK